MTLRLISAAAIATAACLAALGPAWAQTSQTGSPSTPDSSSSISQGATTSSESSSTESRDSAGGMASPRLDSATTDSPSASPNTIESPDKESARARGVDIQSR